MVYVKLNLLLIITVLFSIFQLTYRYIIKSVK